MATNYSVPLSKIIKDNSLEIVYLPSPAEEILISNPDVNRPGLIFAGYDNFFDAVMVMDKDEAVKNNRLGLLKSVDNLICQVADFSKIVLA